MLEVGTMQEVGTKLEFGTKLEVGNKLKVGTKLEFVRTKLKLLEPIRNLKLYQNKLGLTKGGKQTCTQTYYQN